jgi:UDP-glucose 4-epimerase
MAAPEAASVVLVTGGAGYIGSHACKALAAAGWRPVSYDNLSQGHRWAVRWGPLVRGALEMLRRSKRHSAAGPRLPRCTSPA